MGEPSSADARMHRIDSKQDDLVDCESRARRMREPSSSLATVLQEADASVELVSMSTVPEAVAGIVVAEELSVSMREPSSLE